MWYRIVIGVILVLCFMNFEFSESLKDGDDGVCVVKTSTKATRRKVVTVTINKWCGKKKCVVRKNIVQPYSIWKKRTICCTGWEYNSDEDKCTPFCSMGCDKGNCTAPDKCHCEPPLVLEPERKNACTTPICNPQCVNADCGINNTCTCKSGYVSINATLCAPTCELGYTLNEDFHCKPKCENDCGFGNCTAPNFCTCDENYEFKNGTCEAKCECVNADCVDSGCSCHSDYERFNETYCIPKCDECEHGRCVAPNNCSCEDGYTKHNGICNPACDKVCINGICSEPNVCSCNGGFVKNESDPYVCHEITSCAECNGTCNDRGECSCQMDDKNSVTGKITYKCCTDEHWVFDEDESGEGFCKPECEPACINGNCTSPNVCTCNEGYTRNETRPFECNKKPVNKTVLTIDPVDCSECSGNCTDGMNNCHCPGGVPCFFLPDSNDIVSTRVECNTCLGYCTDDEMNNCQCADGLSCSFSPDSKEITSTSLAGLEYTWLIGSVVGLILLTTLIIVISRFWKKRNERSKTAEDNGAQAFDSLMFTRPDALIHCKDIREENSESNFNDDCKDVEKGAQFEEEQQTCQRLILSENNLENA